MYALKARDKLHKREKELDKDMARGAESRAREVDRHHRGDKKKPATSRREAKVCHKVHMWRFFLFLFLLGGGGGATAVFQSYDFPVGTSGSHVHAAEGQLASYHCSC